MFGAIQARLLYLTVLLPVDISTNGVNRNYTSARTTGTDISGLIPGSIYTVLVI
jgi:hypothetical protein